MKIFYFIVFHRDAILTTGRANYPKNVMAQPAPSQIGAAGD